MPADIAALLAEAPWLARLARSLTGDGAEADDLVQDTYAAALRSPPDTERPLRPWLRRVAVNLARMRHRGRTRRAANERIVEVQADPVRTPAQLVERAQLERRLGELVLDLDEPFRTTVLLRYREGLSAEQIAKQQGIPAGTVRSRLKTALDRIRRELDEREHAKMRAVFAAPLGAPGTAGPAPATPPALWRLVMAKVASKIGVTVVAVLLFLLGGAVLWHRSSQPRQGDELTAHATRSAEQARSLVTRPAMFAQPGIAARRVRGRVSSDGAPYHGAIVQLVHAQTEVVLAETKSAADGTFDLGERPADAYIVAASAPDLAALPVQIDLRAPKSPELELRLVGCSHLRGTIVDGSGAPIAHARVARDGVPSLFAESDANGRYDLCTHFGTTTIRYSASGYQSVMVWLDVSASSTRDVVLTPEATIEGTVISASDAPVAGAWVVIDPYDKGTSRDGRATGFSESDGTFRITGVSPGRNLIAGFAPGQRSTHTQEIVTGAGQVTRGIVVRLAPAATITGTVVSGGAPVAGVGIGMRIGNRDQQTIFAVTQSDGSFAIDRAPRGDVALYVENHTVIAPRSVHIGDAPANVRVEVSRLGSVRGRVLRSGEPVGDAQVTCPRTKVFTNADGSYVCDGVDEGPQELFADAASGEWGRGKVQVERAQTAFLDIPLTFSAAICGTLVDELGAPLSGLEVRVAEETTNDFGKDTSGANGSFCARLLTGGTYHISVYAGARVLEPLVPLDGVTLGPTETKHVSIAVTAPRLAIAGSVRDAQGAPVADAVVRCVAANKVGKASFDLRQPSSLTITDDDGHFELTKLAAGEYTLAASARDGSEVIQSPVAAGARDVVITVEPAGRIEGKLVGFTSQPTVTLVATTGTHVALDAAVDGNRFSASGLSPATYLLMAVTDGHEGDTQEVVVRPGQPTSVTMTSRGTATIAGVVRDLRTREPVPFARCNATTRQGVKIGAIYTGPDDGVVADARGEYRMTSPAGEILVMCKTGSASGERMAVAARDRATHIDVLTVSRGEQGSIDARFEWLANRFAELTKGGAADRAGLAVGDDVVEVDGVSVTDLASQGTMRLITQRPAGTTARLTIVRGGQRQTISVTVRTQD